MKYLLDTCVIFEFTREYPYPSLVEWLNQQEESALHLSVISIGEIQKSLSRMGHTKKTHKIQKWLDDSLTKRFETRLLPLNKDILTTWGRISTSCEIKGHPLHVIDGLIAATAVQHNLTIVTRYTYDYKHLGLPILNPWEMK